jgi:hypothetical protein
MIFYLNLSFLLLLLFKSLLMMKSIKNKLSKKQKQEMKHRAILFLNYFIRSPFYEVFSRSAIEVSLNIATQNIPGARLIASKKLVFLLQ